MYALSFSITYKNGLGPLFLSLTKHRFPPPWTVAVQEHSPPRCSYDFGTVGDGHMVSKAEIRVIATSSNLGKSALV
jgi:hypothetical protein